MRNATTKTPPLVIFAMLVQIAVMLYMTYAISIQGEKIKEWRTLFHQEEAMYKLKQNQLAETSAALQCLAKGFRFSRLQTLHPEPRIEEIQTQCSHDQVKWESSIAS